MADGAPQVIESVERVRLGSLRELDALIGERLTREIPRKHWEDAVTHFRFESIEEAFDALHDPFFRPFVPEGGEAKPMILSEVKEFGSYSSDLNTTWTVVDQVSATLGVPLLVRRERENWFAAFGEKNAVAPTAAIAICIAALRTTGIEVDLETDPLT